MEFCDLSLFGLTLQLLTANHGQELLMSYLRAFPVKTSARPARVPELMENAADYGFKLSASVAKYDQEKSIWKTRQCSLVGDLDEFSGTWPNWGFMLDGESC